MIEDIWNVSPDVWNEPRSFSVTNHTTKSYFKAKKVDVRVQGCDYFLETKCTGAEPVHNKINEVTVEKIFWLVPGVLCLLVDRSVFPDGRGSSDSGSVTICDLCVVHDL